MVKNMFQGIKESNEAIVQDIVRSYLGLDLEEKDAKGNTFLNFAVQMGNYEIAELLLRKGAFVNT